VATSRAERLRPSGHNHKQKPMISVGLGWVGTWAASTWTCRRLPHVAASRAERPRPSDRDNKNQWLLLV